MGYSNGATLSNIGLRNSDFKGQQFIGGLVGVIFNSTITNCYSTGSVSGTNYVGGLVGSNFGTITNCFWDTQTSGITATGAGTGKTTAQMQTQSTFTGWDFITETVNGTADIWKMDNVGNYGGYPVFSTQELGVVTSVNDEQSTATSLVLFPNSTTGLLNIISSSDIAKIEVFNSQGMLMLEENNAVESINLSNVQAGIYLLRITDTSGRVVSKRVERMN